MIPFEVLSVLPPQGATPEAAAHDCLEQLVGRLRDSGRATEHVLSLTLFVSAREPDAFAESRRIALQAVEDTFPDASPPASIVGQPPEGERHFALEAAVLLDTTSGAKVERRQHEGLRYTVVIGAGGRQVHAAGLASRTETMGPADRSREAFSAAQAILDAEGLNFGQIVRQWNYLEEMLDLSSTTCGDSQGYQAFNDVRSIAYGRSTFPEGYPAATGIGQKVGGVCIEFVAVDPGPGARVAAISNPKQIDAHRYSEDVLVGAAHEDLDGTTSPKFERGKRVTVDDTEIVFVSGTASILGELTVAPGDVRAQTRTTIANIDEVLAGQPLTHLRAYVKRAEDIAAVREECRAAYGDVPSLYVEADVCRDDLLVELEGESVARQRPEARSRN